MKIGSPPPVSGVARAGSKAYERSGGAASPSAAARAEDSASIMGIPETEFTPRVRAAIMALMAEVENLRRELQQTQGRLGELEKLADEDSLLPMSNRRAFVRELDRTISFAHRYGGSASLVYIDMDGLKRINDTWGHAAGDAAILAVGNVLLQNVRRSDVVGRLGGDEFGVILVQADVAMAQRKAEQLGEAVRATPLHHAGEAIPLSISWGCHNIANGENPAEALAAADRQMYSQKRSKA